MQRYFIDPCRLPGEPTPAAGDPAGKRYRFERGAWKDSGGGWADVRRHGRSVWGHWGGHADPDAAFNRSRLQAPAPENPPPITSDMERTPHPLQLAGRRGRAARVCVRRSRRRRGPRQA